MDEEKDKEPTVVTTREIIDFRKLYKKN